MRLPDAHFLHMSSSMPFSQSSILFFQSSLQIQPMAIASCCVTSNNSYRYTISILAFNSLLSLLHVIHVSIVRRYEYIILEWSNGSSNKSASILDTKCVMLIGVRLSVKKYYYYTRK